jgi:hypothetical protein
MRLTPLLLIAPVCLSLSFAPVAAQEAAPEDDFGKSLIEQGAKMLLRGLMSEAEPMLDEMGRSLREMEPALREMGPKLKVLFDLMGDAANYEVPERMPNGDILIRRKMGAPPAPALPGPPEPDANRLDQNGEIEL